MKVNSLQRKPWTLAAAILILGLSGQTALGLTMDILNLDCTTVQFGANDHDWIVVDVYSWVTYDCSDKSPQINKGITKTVELITVGKDSDGKEAICQYEFKAAGISPVAPRVSGKGGISVICKKDTGEFKLCICEEGNF